MKKVLAILLCCLLSVLTGCVSEEVFENTRTGNVEALWQIIDEHHCFLSYKKQTLGVDWKEVRGRYVKNEVELMDRYELFDHCAKMLSELKDGHVNLYSAADIGRNWSWRDDYPKNLDVELREKYLGTDYKIAGGLKYRILERERVDGNGDAVKDSVGYVVYESFSSGISDANINEVFYHFIDCKGIIPISLSKQRLWAIAHSRPERDGTNSPQSVRSGLLRPNMCVGCGRSSSSPTGDATLPPTPLYAI
jgi:hypothetical protein